MISNVGRGGRRDRPYAFTEQGVATLSSVLRSPRAVQVNIAFVRAFVKLREILASHRDLARHLEDLSLRNLCLAVHSAKSKQVATRAFIRSCPNETAQNLSVSDEKL